MDRHYTRHGRCAPRGRRHRHGYGRGGPRARRGDVRAAALALLTERPMHGYEMIKEIEERTGGIWQPSAGSIYPTLALLEDEGLVRSEESEGKRRFTLTDEGREQAEARSGDSPWEQVTARRRSRRAPPPPGLRRAARGRAAGGHGRLDASRPSARATCSTRRARRSTRSSPRTPSKQASE